MGSKWYWIIGGIVLLVIIVIIVIVLTTVSDSSSDGSSDSTSTTPSSTTPSSTTPGGTSTSPSSTTSGCTYTTLFPTASDGSSAGPFLTINSAYYGTGTAAGTGTIDVTNKVKPYLKYNSLGIVVSNDIFTDPAVNSVKKLTVNYTNEQGSYTATGSEGTSLFISANASVDTSQTSTSLTIVTATYGLLKDVDVTDKLKVTTTANTSTTSTFTVGNDLFSDPNPGVPKFLAITYKNTKGTYTEVYKEGSILYWTTDLRIAHCS